MAVTKHERRMQRKQRQREDLGPRQQPEPVNRVSGADRAAGQAEAEEEAVRDGEAVGDAVGEVPDGGDDAENETSTAQSGGDSLGGPLGEEARLMSANMESEAKHGEATRESKNERRDGGHEEAATTRGSEVSRSDSGPGDVVRDEDAPTSQNAAVAPTSTNNTTRTSPSNDAEEGARDGERAIDDAGREPVVAHSGLPPRTATISPKDSLRRSATESELRAFTKPAAAPPCGSDLLLERPSILSSPGDVQSKIEQLERDVNLLLQQKIVTRLRQSSTLGEAVSSPVPSDSTSIDAAESVDTDPPDSTGNAHNDKKQAKIHELKAQLDLAQRKAEMLEAEKLLWTEAASASQDFRSLLLEARVEKRALAEKLHRIVQDEHELAGNSQTLIVKLRDVINGLNPRNLSSNGLSTDEFSESLVFRPDNKSERGGSATKAWNWLWGEQTPSKDYGIRVMRLQEVPLKRQRENEGSVDAYTKSFPSRNLENQQDLEELHSLPQLKRSRTDDIDSESSDEEEFLCHVDSSGKVTALGYEDTDAQDVFLAVSM